MGICLGVLVGIGLVAVCIGFLSAGIILICIYIGVIRIMPLVNLCKRVFQMFPFYAHIIKNIKDNFKIRGSIPSERSIYMWHPHGVFSITGFFHNASCITDWPERNTKTAVLSLLAWIPFSEEFFEELKLIPNTYHSMKNVLESGTSLSLSPGGMREMLYKDSAILSKRRGIFKMALETGTQLVPILSVNEDRLCSIIKIPWIQDWLEPYDICIPIPNMKSVYKLLCLLVYPLKDPVISIVGPPVSVERVEMPSETQISELRERYIVALKTLYKSETGKELLII